MDPGNWKGLTSFGGYVSERANNDTVVLLCTLLHLVQDLRLYVHPVIICHMATKNKKRPER
jgi:hypothetical protein